MEFMTSLSPLLTEELLRGINVLVYVQVAVTTAALYDHVLAISREVELIWMKPMTLVTVLYVTERYLGDVVLVVFFGIFIRRSVRLFEFRAWGALVYAWGTQATMQLRLYAMYRRSRTILILLLIMFVCEIAAIAFIIFRQIGPHNHLQVTNISVFGNHFCSFSGINSNFVYIFIPFVAFEFFLFLLAARMFVENMKRNRGEEKGFRLNTFMRVLARDSFCYFLLNMLASSIVTGMWLTLNPIYAIVCIPFVMLLEVLVGTRLILGFRERYARSDAGPIVSGKQSSLQFREDNTNPHVHSDDTDLQTESHRMSVRCQTETIVVSDVENLGGRS